MRLKSGYDDHLSEKTSRPFLLDPQHVLEEEINLERLLGQDQLAAETFRLKTLLNDLTRKHALETAKDIQYYKTIIL